MKASSKDLKELINGVRAKSKLNGITGDWHDTANFSTADDEVNGSENDSS